jgi:hypothetical protein
VEAQNSYYRAKDEAASSYERGSATLLALLELEKAHPEVSEWGFKAVKRLTKMHIGVGNFATGLQSFKCVRSKAQRERVLLLLLLMVLLLRARLAPILTPPPRPHPLLPHPPAPAA